jgi:DNA uptake protein ComE-like DNA-binding protein
MKLPRTFEGDSALMGASRPRAFVLVAVLVVVMLLAMLVISLLFRFQAEDTAASASVGGEQAWAAAMSGVEEALRVAGNVTPGATDWQENPGAFRERLVFDDGGERWFYSVFSAAGSDALAPVRFGLTDEASKLNVNAASDANFEKLPRVTPAMAAALLDYIDEDDVPRPEGAEQEYYSALPRPYRIRNGPLASLDELLLVRGFTPDLVHGGVATNETSNARPVRGLDQLLTVVSYDPDKANDGAWRVNLNNADAVWPEVELPPAVTNFIFALRTNGIELSHAAYLLEATLPVKDAKGADAEIASGVGKAELALVLDRFTGSAEPQTAGLLNVNTASATVLATLPGVDEALAETIVSTRGALPPDRKTTTAWLYQEGVLDAVKFKALAPLLTTRSAQFTFQVIGYGLPSGRFRVLEAGIDVANGARRVTYLRDVTRRGLPFPLASEGDGKVAAKVKVQTPSSKSQRSSKLQIPRRGAANGDFSRAGYLLAGNVVQSIVSAGGAEDSSPGRKPGVSEANGQAPAGRQRLLSPSWGFDTSFVTTPGLRPGLHSDGPPGLLQKRPELKSQRALQSQHWDSNFGASLELGPGSLALSKTEVPRG